MHTPEQEAKPVLIRFSHNQVGTLIEASQNGTNWNVVQLLKHGGFLNTARTEARYTAMLDARHISYKVVQS